MQVRSSSRVYRVTAYGADPTGKADSTEALLAAISDAVNGSSKGGSLMEGIADLGGAHIALEGGKYTISRPLRFPTASVGNLLVMPALHHHSRSPYTTTPFPFNICLIRTTPPNLTAVMMYSS